jgi:hypothetical protein
MLSRYAELRGMQVAQTAACNRLHDIKQRLARWLLMTQDRVEDSDEMIRLGKLTDYGLVLMTYIARNHDRFQRSLPHLFARRDK